MERTTQQFGMAAVLVAAVLAWAAPTAADEFTQKDLERWEGEYTAVAKQGRQLFIDDKLGRNGVVCAQCHPNAANTHPETYPKFQKQLGKVAAMWEMINWCIRNPLEGTDLEADDPRMTALQAYIASERRGVQLQPGKH